VVGNINWPLKTAAINGDCTFFFLLAGIRRCPAFHFVKDNVGIFAVVMILLSYRIEASSVSFLDAGG